MKQRLEEIEKELMAIYYELKEQYPALHHLSFEITTYESSIGTRIGGYYHIGKGCEIWKTVSELVTLVTEAKIRRLKNQILFQKFDHVLL